MRIEAIAIYGLCVALTASCSKSPTNEAQPAPSAATMSDEALDQAPIPVKEDFEEQATQAINEDNLEEQLSKLEKEIESDR